MSGLKALYRENRVAQQMLDHFASRRNDSTATKLDRALTLLAGRGIVASRAQVREVFRELEKLGCGKYVMGRRGWPSRFEWSVGLVSVGQAASGEEVEIEEVTPQAAAEADDDAAGEALEHVFQLRPALPVTLTLPADLTPTEASRLSDFIRTLPFHP
jgi:hypothetical protein